MIYTVYSRVPEKDQPDVDLRRQSNTEAPNATSVKSGSMVRELHFRRRRRDSPFFACYFGPWSALRLSSSGVHRNYRTRCLSYLMRTRLPLAILSAQHICINLIRTTSSHA